MDAYRGLVEARICKDRLLDFGISKPSILALNCFKYQPILKVLREMFALERTSCKWHGDEVHTLTADATISCFCYLTSIDIYIDTTVLLTAFTPLSVYCWIYIIIEKGGKEYPDS